MGNRRVIFTIAGAYLFTVGVLSGVLVDRIQFDQSRSVLLSKLEGNTHRLHQRLITLEREQPDAPRRHP